MNRVADKVLAWLNLRTLVAGLALALLLSPSPPQAFEWLDRLIFRLGTQLQNVPPPSLGISIVELPPDEVDYLLNEPGRAANTFQLLDRVTRSDKVIVGVILPRPVRPAVAADHLLRDILWPGEGGPVALPQAVKQSAERYLSTAQGLYGFEQHPRVVFSGGSTSSLPVTMEATEASERARWLPKFWRPPLPAAAQEGALLLAGSSEPQPSALLRMYAALNGADEVRWQQYRGIRLGGIGLPLSANGTIKAYPHRENGSRHSLAEALEDRLDHNVLLLGAAGAPELYAMASGLRSLDSQSYYRTPLWLVPAKALLLLALATYLVLALPRLGAAAGVLATSLIAIVILVAQLGWQITQWQWLSMGVSLQFLLLGHLLIWLWKTQQERLLNLRAAAHGARYQLGLQLFRDGRSDDALLAIRECHSTEAVLGLMYDIASQQERKRHYGEAVKSYLDILKRRKSYRDVAQKVEKLIAFSSTGAVALTGETEIAKTLIVSESSINKPVLGRYEVERELGRGAMGVVYLGRDPKIARYVAVKTLSYSQVEPAELEEFKQRFFREAEAAGRLNHPNIVTIYDVGEEHDLAFIAMDYVEGVALSACVADGQRLPVKDALQAVADAADALDYAHGKQVVHRDVKPANILYQPQTRHVKVTDFGVARLVDHARTSTGNILGSPLYMSPEQLRGGRVERQTDIYSLGVTLFQLLTGELPFGGDNLASLTYNIIHDRAPNIRRLRPDLPASVSRIVNKALQKEPQKRFPSAASMAEALRKAAIEC